MSMLLPPFWLIRLGVAAVWAYEGLWCKLLGRETQAARRGRGGAAPRPTLGRALLEGCLAGSRWMMATGGCQRVESPGAVRDRGQSCCS